VTNCKGTRRKEVYVVLPCDVNEDILPTIMLKLKTRDKSIPEKPRTWCVDLVNVAGKSRVKM
jgi:hypothetical protein